MLGKIHLFLFLLIAPIVGVGYAFYQIQPVSSPLFSSLRVEAQAFSDQTGDLKKELSESAEDLKVIESASKQDQRFYEQHQQQVAQLIQASKEHQQHSEDLIEQLLSSLLGKPVAQHFGNQSIIKVYSLEEAGYRGYMAKVRLLTPNALKLTLAHNQLRSKGETTSQAAKRTGAMLAINAGGFFYDKGNIAPLGITVVDGQIKGFSHAALSFVGFNDKGHLIGGTISKPEQIAEQHIKQGASFLPTLLQNAQKQKIPKEWANKRQPRTLIGHFINNDLLIIVIDGRRKGWSQGVTLEEAQDKLLDFKVKDAYNLDGGSSSSFVFNGKVLNKPSEGKEHPVATNFVVLP